MKNLIFKTFLLLAFTFLSNNVKSANYEIVINNSSGCTFDSISFRGSGSAWFGAITSVGAGTTTISCMAGNITNIFFFIGGNSFSVPPIALIPVQCWMNHPSCVNEPCFNGTHFYDSNVTVGGATFPCVGDLLTINIS